MKIAWLTDTHLKMASVSRRRSFHQELVDLKLDGIFVSGDVSESTSLLPSLEFLESAVSPVYFVLGNHDYYFDSIEEVRKTVRENQKPSLKWMPDCGVVSLTDKVAVVGHDGWADGRFGDWEGSRVELNDYRCISELTHVTKEIRLRRMQGLAQEAADHFERVIPEALKDHEQVFVLVHAPPFENAAWHMGRRSDNDYLPHFSSKVIGESIVKASSNFPTKLVMVLCGHTHGTGRITVPPNIEVFTGMAEYGNPVVQVVFDIQ